MIIADDPGGKGDFIKGFDTAVMKRGPDVALDDLVPLAQAAEEKITTIVAAFKEPPPLGSTVIMKISAFDACKGIAKTLSTRFRVVSITPYSVFAGWTMIDKCVNKVDVDVALDGVVVATKSVSVANP